MLFYRGDGTLTPNPTPNPQTPEPQTPTPNPKPKSPKPQLNPFPPADNYNSSISNTFFLLLEWSYQTQDFYGYIQSIFNLF